jgi:hypothetical protein
MKMPPATRLKIVSERFVAPAISQRDPAIGRTSVLTAYGVAGFTTQASLPARLRIWCGTTVRPMMSEALGPWLDWAWASLKS